MTTTEGQLSALALQGKEAATLLWTNWKDRPSVDDPFSPEFANAALVELERLQRELPGLLQEVLEGAGQGAESLTIGPHQGLLEVLQNADDAGASSLRIALVERDENQFLVMIHNGKRVDLRDVIGMTFAFISTKREDAAAKGRFGIGLKTLDRMGDQLEVHCPPYHFRIIGTRCQSAAPWPIERETSAPGDPPTLLALRLRDRLEVETLAEVVTGWGTETLVFLDAIREVCVLDDTTREESARIAIAAQEEPDSMGESLSHIALRDEAADRSWDRYTWTVPVPKDLRRRHKATANSTPLSIAISSTAPARIYAGLPLPIKLELPFSINGQFDPDTPRTGLQASDWNAWLLTQLGTLTFEVAMRRFESSPPEGWAGVGLDDEVDMVADDWLRTRLISAMASGRDRVLENLRVQVGASALAVTDLVYEVDAVEGLLGPGDIAALRPERTLLPEPQRDADRRWRKVLRTTDAAIEVTVEDALTLFANEHTAVLREPSWICRLCAAALGENLSVALQTSYCLPVGALRMSPAQLLEEGRQAVDSAAPESLGVALGVFVPLDTAFAQDSVAREVILPWLQRLGVFTSSADDWAALRALARRSTHAPLLLADASLLRIRELLSSPALDDHRQLALEIGRGILVDGYTYADRIRRRQPVLVAEAYLSASIAGGGDPWSRAAGDSPGPQWIDQRYVTLFRRTGGGLGARAFFTLLGAETAPRPKARPVQDSRYSEWASFIEDTAGGRRQRALSGGRATHVRHDFDCPDLERVLDALLALPLSERRPRAHALFSTLRIAWRRLYSDAAQADAVYSDYSWRSLGPVPSAWLASLQSRPWLSNEESSPFAPIKLAVRSPRMVEIFGEDPTWYAHEIPAEESDGTAAEAIGLETYPRMSRLLDILEETRASHGRGEPVNPYFVAKVYLAISTQCPSEGAPLTMVGDVPGERLRTRFGTTNSSEGLMLAGGAWLPPSQVFRGRPWFGSRRAFVPTESPAERLWRVLHLRLPDIADGIDVAREIAKEPFSTTAGNELADTYRFLSENLGRITPTQRQALRRLPLWSTQGVWLRDRPIFHAERSDLRSSLSVHVPMWEPPCSTHALGALPAALGVQQIRPSWVRLAGMPSDAPESRVLTETFRAAVHLLRSYLADQDPGLEERCSDWSELASARCVLIPDLSVEFIAPNRPPALIEVSSHLEEGIPDTYAFRTPDAAGDSESGGRLVASQFEAGDSTKLALAWAHVWLMAEKGLRAATRSGEPPELDALAALAGQAQTAADLASRQTSVSARRNSASAPNLTAQATIQPAGEPLRFLKTIGELRSAAIRIAGDTAGGKERVVSGRGLRSAWEISHEPGQRSAGRAAYSSEELQRLGWQCLKSALEVEGATELQDLQALRGIGADGIDGLKRYFELKTSGRGLPTQVSLTPNEVERAQREGDKFFLAVVSGLEEGSTTTIRIFANPLQTLDWRVPNGLILVGLHEKRGLTIQLEGADSSESAGSADTPESAPA